MDKMKAENLKSLNNHKHSTLFFSNNLILHCLVVLLCLLCSCAEHWFPSLYTFVIQFIPISLPNTFSFFFQPNCLFIVVNVIVVILVGESKLVGSYSSPATGIYDEYLQRSQSLRGQYSTVQETKEGELETKLDEENVQIDEHKEKDVMWGEDDQKDGEEEEEEGALPAEELNKKVEEFIARVKRQRRMEAREVEPPITKQKN